MANPIAYGADWSAAQIYGSALAQPVNDRRDGTGNWYRLSFTLRYADFPGQGHAVLTKEEYESHLAAGLRSMLIYQRTTRDPDGGEARGREFGRAAVAYARKIGYRQGEPIFATADAPIGSYNLDVAEAFFRGFAAEVRASGFLAGGYGFRDAIYRLQDRGVVDVLWLCGAESGWRPGIAIYQWNNGRIYPSGVEADLVKQFETIPGGDMPLNPDVDYPAFKTMLQRFLAFESRPGGAEPSWEKGPTIYERLGAIAEDIAAVKADVATLKASGIPVKAEVDWAEGAKVINDEDDRRDRDGDPSTGPVS